MTTTEALLDALTITPAGEIRPVQLAAGRVLEGLYREIGCRMVDVIRLTPDLDMWVDDEFLFTARDEPNELATAFVFALTCRPVSTIFGTVVLTGGADEDGNTVSLADPQVRHLLEAVARIL